MERSDCGVKSVRCLGLKLKTLLHAITTAIRLVALIALNKMLLEQLAHSQKIYCAIMPKTKLRAQSTSGNYETRLAVAQSLNRGDRVRHRVTGKLGVFQEINLGYALPEVWVQFDSDSEIVVPTSCNPLDLELINSDPNQSDEIPSGFELCDPEAILVPAVEVLEELTEAEVALRYRLELKVERAFSEAGAALNELRDKRLYRSTHRTFEKYCRDRFGFTYRHVNYLIAASQVVRNLQMGTNGSQTENVGIGTNQRNILPTSERQVRDLFGFEPDDQKEIWQLSVDDAGGKVPSSRIVKRNVERFRETKSRPISFEPLAYSEEDVVKICRGDSKLQRHLGYWGVIQHVGSFNCIVRISLKSEDVRCKANEMRKIEPEKAKLLREVSERIAALVRCKLDPAVWAILQTINQQEDITQVQLDLLTWAEQRYRVQLYDN
jgi:hypothetical protein